MSNYKIELERTEKQNLKIKKHILDVKNIVKSKVNKDVNGLNSIKVLLENETLGGYIVDDFIKIENLEVVDFIPDEKDYTKSISVTADDLIYSVTNTEDGNVCVSTQDKYLIKYSSSGVILWKKGLSNRGNHLSSDDYGNIYLGVGEYGLYYGKNGNLIKEINLGARVTSTSTSEDGKHIAFGTDNGYVYLFDEKGQKKLTIKKNYEITSLKIKRGFIYVGEGDSYNQGNKKIYKIKIDGQDIWNYVDYTYEINGIGVSDYEKVFFGGDKKAVQLNDMGQKLWEKTFSEYPVSTGTDSRGNCYVALKNRKYLKTDESGNNILSGEIGFGKSLNGFDVNDGGNMCFGTLDKEVIKMELKRELLGYKVLKVERS